MLNRIFLRGIATGIGCALVAAALGMTPLGSSLDEWFTDACFVVRGGRATDARVVIIALDDDSLDRLLKPSAYTSPELARVVRYAEVQGARAIGIDVFIPQSLSGLREIEDGIGDARSFGEVVAGSTKVVLPEFYERESREVRRPLIQWWALLAAEGRPARFGLLNLTEDGDQFIRKQALVDDPSSTAPQPFFALALYARSRDVDFATADKGRTIVVGDRRAPMASDGRMRINFVGPPGTFPVISLSRILESERAGRPTPELRGAVVIVGVTGMGHQDFHPTPYANGAARLFSGRPAGLTQGPELHANAFATLHDGAFLTRPWWVEPGPWAILAGAGLGAAFARLGLSRGASLLVVYFAALAVCGYAAYRYLGWVMNPIPLAMTGGLTYSVVLARRWWQLRRMMAVVKSEAVTRALESDPRRLDPGGELREVTALFADIRGFTTFSERCGNDPHKVVALLNAYFELVVPMIESEGGTVMSFMGDGVMALFGSPVSQRDHAAHAVRAAIKMARAIRANAKTWADRECPGMKVGIGVHTGMAVVGAVGGRTRLDYTAIGDTINTASRVEGKTKAFLADILITASTREALGGNPGLGGRCQPIDQPVDLAGRSEPVFLSRVDIDPELR